MQTLAPGTFLQNRYRILRAIGRGGMGAVYEAQHEGLLINVALKQFDISGKVSDDQAERLRQAFKREAMLLSRLRHPALPTVTDHFIDATGQYLVMDYITGKDLAEVLKENSGAPLSLDNVMGWADQLLDALHYLHSHDPPILHRDIKPENIKLTPEGQIMLLDFGLASGSALLKAELGDKADMGPQTHTIAAGYTPGYAPLEQVQRMPNTPQSDLYSLAATLYLLLTGQQPVRAVERSGMIFTGQSDPLRPIHEINPAVPRHISDALMGALSLKVPERPANAMVLSDMLQGKAPGTIPLDSQPTPNPDQEEATLMNALLTPQTGSTSGASEGADDQEETVISQPQPVQTGPTPGASNSPESTVISQPQSVPLPDTSTSRPSAASKQGGFPLVPVLGGGVVLVVLVAAAVGAFLVFGSNNGNGTGTPTQNPSNTSPPPPPGAITSATAAQVRATQVLEGHSEGVNGVAFSPDHQTLASASQDGTIKLWNAVNGTELRTLSGHDDWVNSVAFSPDGALLASASDDETVRLWRVSDGSEQYALEGGDAVLRVVFAPDGATLASAGADGVIRFWDAANGSEIRTLEGHGDEIPDLAFSPDGSLLASASHDHTVRIWRVSDGTPLQTLEEDQNWVSSVAFSPDGTLLASGSQNGTIRLWRVQGETATLQQAIAAITTPIESLSFSADSQLFATASPDRTIRLWQAGGSRPIHELTGHTARVFSVAFANDGTMMVSGSADSTVRIWQAEP